MAMAHHPEKIGEHTHEFMPGAVTVQRVAVYSSLYAERLFVFTSHSHCDDTLWIFRSCPLKTSK